MSRGQIEHQSDEYRKGQVLGFTMAEIMLVILFLLLLLLGSKINKQADALSTSYQKDTLEYQAINKIKKTLSELQSQGAVDGKKDVNWLAERLVLEEKDMSESSKTAQKLAPFISKNNLTFEEGKQCLATCGGGPRACWGESLSNPDYIYNVALYDDAIYITNNPENIIKNIADWDSIIQPARIENATLLTNNQFRSRFARLREHARVNECVYQVRLVDVFTSSKAIYKKQRQLVEGYVYPTPLNKWTYGTLPE
jgi:hypothetical protein